MHDFNYYSMCTTYQVCVLNTKGKTQTQTSLDIFFGGLRLQTPPGTQHSRLSCFLFFVFETPTLARACLPVCLPARPPARVPPATTALPDQATERGGKAQGGSNLTLFWCSGQPRRLLEESLDRLLVASTVH